MKPKRIILAGGTGFLGRSLADSPTARGDEVVVNAGFMSELRRVLRRPWSPPTPARAVPIGCWLMRTEPVLALTGRRGIPQRLQDAGFTFEYPTLPAALEQLFKSKS